MAVDATLMRLVSAMAENEEFRRDLVALATQHGVDLTGGELSDGELDAVAGGGSMEDVLASVGDDAQLGNISLQNTLQQQQQTLQTISNVSKMLHDTAMAVVRKIG